MSSSVPQQLQGSEAPNTIEQLWERHRAKLKALFWLLALGLAGFYGWKYYERKQLDEKWSAFATRVQLESIAAPEEVDRMLAAPFELTQRLLSRLEEATYEELEAGLTAAAPIEVPYIHWAIANKAFRERDWQRARSELELIQSRFPKHPLCVESPFPIQVRNLKPEDDEDEPAQDINRRNQKPDYEEPRSGSTVGLLLQAIATAESFQLPSQFDRVPVPDDAPRYVVTLSEPFGSFTIALMKEQAPKHCEVFERLAAADHWNGMRIDEINNPPPRFRRIGQSGMQFHFGFPSTRGESDRTKWDTTKPSDEENVVEESTGLSHWPGAVAARASTPDGDSQVDKLWITAEDMASQDGFRQVFAYVVDGLETVEEVVLSGFERSEDEQMGRGRPAENIEIVSIKKVE